MRGTRARRLQTGEAGFSLIELVVVITIAALLAGLMTSFIARPMEMYTDVRLRGALVDLAEGAVRRAARDVRAALPNSLRVGGSDLALELLHTADGGRYRAAPGVNPSTEDHSAASDNLDFTGDTQFNQLGRFAHLVFVYDTPLAAGHRLAIYTTDSGVWSDAATDANPGTLTAAATTLTISDDTDEDQLTLSSSHQFSLASPRQRFYIIDGPVSYLCNLSSGTLTRYSGYAPASAQPTDPSVSPLSSASSALVVNGVTACAFTYDAGTSTRAGLVTIALTLGQEDEQVRLFHQVHLANAP